MVLRARALHDSGPQRADLSAEQIDDVVNQLNGICRSSSLEFALRVGAVVIHNVYGGDTQAWRERGPKANSFRRLAEHPDIALSAGQLYRAVAIFEICDRLRAAARWRRLGASHLRVVIGVPAERQEQLLNQANEERWSVQMLHAKAQSLKPGRWRGGRRPESVLHKHLRLLGRCLKGSEFALKSVSAHPLDDLERSLDLLREMKASMDELAGAVEAHRRQLAPNVRPPMERRGLRKAKALSRVPTAHPMGERANSDSGEGECHDLIE